MFRPILVTVGGRQITVTGIADALAAAERLEWAGSADPALVRVEGLLREAVSGACTPRTAFNAFVRSARGQGILQEIEPSVAWRDFEEGIDLRVA